MKPSLVEENLIIHITPNLASAALKAAAEAEVKAADLAASESIFLVSSRKPLW